jgi:hypothetical protein
MKRLGRLVEAVRERPSERQRRGPRRQRRRRVAERRVRLSALAYLRWAVRRGMTIGAVSRKLGVDTSTLFDWRQRWKDDRLERRDRGRPTEAVDADMRWSFLMVFGLMGPQVGLPTIQSLFPDMARSAIIDWQRRCRGIYRRSAEWIVLALRWTRAGSVWAIDFADPPAPIEKLYKKIFVIRDLASGDVLLAIPTPEESATLVRRVLGSLFKWFGKPLVIKADNGGPFVSEELKAFLQSEGVHVLYSPERTPRYNGSVEAGIGSIKVRAFWQAALHDRPGDWTCDDIEAAVRQANETGRPNGRLAPTPQEAWLARSPITETERRSFDELCDRYKAEEYTQRGWLQESSLQHREQASIDRVAISRALIDSGLLLIRRRRITPPISVFRSRKIS